MIRATLQILTICVLYLQRCHSQSVNIEDIITTPATSSFEDAVSLINSNATTVGIVSPVAQATSSPTISSQAEATSGATVSSMTQVPPTPMSTFIIPYESPSDEFSGPSLSVIAVLSLTFPSNATFNISAVSDIATDIQSFLSTQTNFSSVPIAVEAELGDTYGVAPSLTEGKVTLATTIKITVPRFEMNSMDEYTLQLLLSEVVSSSEDQLVDMLSKSFGLDLQANGVEVGFVVIFTPPTQMPTSAPTTLAELNAKRRAIITRSWLFVALFWVIVLCCFSLENGLCASRRFEKKKEEYAGVEMGTGGFD